MLLKIYNIINYILVCYVLLIGYVYKIFVFKFKLNFRIGFIGEIILLMEKLFYKYCIYCIRCVYILIFLIFFKF